MLDATKLIPEEVLPVRRGVPEMAVGNLFGTLAAFTALSEAGGPGKPLEAVLEDWTPPLAPLSLYYPGRRHPSAAFKALIGTVRGLPG